jgi:toxin ParE1/3/4
VNYSYSFLPAAEAEYVAAVEFFEERRKGLGAALVAEFEQVVQLALERPQAWKLVHTSGIRRIGLRRFPYAIFYPVAGRQTTGYCACPSSEAAWLLA